MWNYASFASGKALVLITLAVLARLLTPADFGIVGFATLALAYLAVLKDLGLGGALIQRKDDTEEAAQTVYTLNLILGVVPDGGDDPGRPPGCVLLHEPLVTPILRVLSVTFLIEALGIGPPGAARPQAGLPSQVGARHRAGRSSRVRWPSPQHPSAWGCGRWCGANSPE